MTSWIVPPTSPTGNNRRIELCGMDLCIAARIDNVFVYPSALNVDNLKDALGRVLSLWPLIAGRLLLLDNGEYVIEMADNSIPVTLVDNIDLPKWPFDFNIVVDTSDRSLQSFVDDIQVMKLVRGCQDEPLFRLKLTRLIQSGE